MGTRRRNRGRSGIYCIHNFATGKSYVGSASQLQMRWRVHVFHLKNGTHHSSKLQRSWDKHGEMAFQFLILEECAREVLLDREQFYIGKFNAVHGGYNVLPIAGSSIGQKRTDETRAKISANVKKLSPKERERRRAVAAVTCADPEWRLKHSAMAKSLWTEERKRAWSVRMKKKFKDDPSLREKIRAARTGTKASKESREKQSAVRRGRKATLAHREAISRGLKGHFVSAETREKIRQANSGKTYRDSRQGILI